MGNPAYGSDSDLYVAMGYVRKSQRQSGLTQKSDVPPPPPPATNALFLQSNHQTRAAETWRVFFFAFELRSRNSRHLVVRPAAKHAAS